MADRKLALLFQFKGVDGLSPMMKGLAGASGGAAANLRKLTAAERDQKAELGRVRSEIEATSGNITHLLDRERALESQLAKTTKKISDQKAAIARVAKADARGEALRSKGTTNIATGAAIAAPILLAGKDAADFEDGMVDIEQKADLSAAATEKLKNNILVAAKNAKQLPEAMRAGVDFLAGAGLDPDKAVKMMTPIGRAATAYRIQIEDLSRSSFAAVDNLKVPFGQTAKAIDVMAKAGKMGNFEISDMAREFPNLTAKMQGLKQTGVPAVADLAAALQITRKGAGDSAEAATNLGNLLDKIYSPETISKFKKGYGVDLPAAMKRAAKEGKTPIEAIVELTTKVTGGDMEKLGTLFQDTQVRGALLPLIANIDEYRRIRASALAATGVVDADFALRAQKAGANARALLGDLSRLALVAGGALLPAFVEVSGYLTRGADALSKYAAAHPAVVKNIVKIVTMLAMFNLGLGGIRMAIGLVVGPIARIYNAVLWLKNLGPIFRMLVGFGPRILQAFTLMRTAALFLARGVMQAGLMMLANPMILAIVAVVAALAFAGYMIYRHWDKIKAAFSVAWAWMQQAWGNIVGVFKRGVALALQVFFNFTPLGIIIKNIMPALAWLKNIDMLSIGKNLIDGLINGITAKFNALKSTVKGVANSAANWFKERLGIHSPSRVFMGFGDNIGAGLAIGMQRSIKGPMMQARNMAAGVAGAMALAAPVAMPAAASSMADTKAPTAETSSLVTSAIMPSQVAAPSAAPAPIVMRFGDIVIHIHAATDQSPQDIAEAVAQEIEKLKRDSEKAARDAFRDDED